MNAAGLHHTTARAATRRSIADTEHTPAPGVATTKLCAPAVVRSIHGETGSIAPPVLGEGGHGAKTVERKVRLSHCEIFLVQFAPRCTSRFRQVQRGARGAVAVHATARDRNGAPGSALHFKRTERSLVSSVAFAALVYSGLVARSPKSCTCASTELVAYLQITTTAHACRPGCTRVVTQGSSAAALGAFYSAELARYRQFCHVSSCFFPIMQG